MVLSLEALSVARKGKTLVEALSLSLVKGELLHLLAPNGAGKTSLLLCLAGLLAPAAGRCSVAGFDILTEREEALQHIGYVPAGGGLHAGFRVREYLVAAGCLRGLSRAASGASADELIVRLTLEASAFRAVESLSGGYRKRVALAAALVHHPSLLLLDELSSGLDPDWQASFSAILQDCAREAAIVSATHHFDEVSGGRALLLAPGAVPVLVDPGIACDRTALAGIWKARFESENRAGALL